MLILLSALCSLLSPGCPKSASDPAEGSLTRPFSGLRLQVAVPSGLGLNEAWQLPVTEWEDASGAQGAVAETDLAADGALERLSVETMLLVAPWPLAPELIRADWPAAIPAGDDGRVLVGWHDVFDGLRNGPAAPGGTPALLPLSCPTLVCCYRADLLESAGLTPPSTWVEYQRLLDALGEWAHGLSAVEPWSEEFRATMFLARAAPMALPPQNFSLLLDVGTGHSLIGGPPFVRALTEAQAAHARMDGGALTSDPLDCLRDVLEGRAALAITCVPPGAAMDESSAVSVVDRPASARFGFCPLPGAGEVYDRERDAWIVPRDGQPNRVTVTGFDGFVVCAAKARTSREQRAAWSLWAAIEAQSRDGVLNDAHVRGLCRRTQALPERAALAVLRADERVGFGRSIAKSLDGARVIAELPLPAGARFRDALTRGLTRGLESRATPEEALQETAREWESLIEEIGRSDVLDTYRQSLGLAPVR